MKKRITSLLLTLAMLLSLLPAMGMTASAATTGSGTKSDPIVVKTFEELKAALEKDITEMQYIKVPGGTNIDTVLSPETYSAAIAATRKKTLIVDGSVTVTGTGAATSQVLDSLFAITGNNTCLNIKGNGTLTFSANGNNGSNAVVRVDNGATLNVSGGVTLSGKFNTAVYGMAVYNYGGTVNIDDATLTGLTGGISYGAAIYASGGITNIKNATLKNSVYKGAHITRETGRGTIYVGKDASLTIEDSTIYTIDGVADGYSICQQEGTTKYISEYLGTNQKIYKLSDKVPLSADVTSLTDSVYITDDVSEEINTVSLTVEPLINREMISDLACSYSPSSKMTLSNFNVYTGQNNTSDVIEDKNTPYDPNQSYTVMYFFHTKAGFRFSNNLRANLKDNVTVTGGDFWMADDFGGLPNAIRVFVNIPAASAAGQEVKTVTIQVKPKAERKNVETDFRPQIITPASGMTFQMSQVYQKLNGTGGEQATEYDAAKDYSAIYQFKTESGYVVAESITAADVTLTSGDGQIWKINRYDENTLLVYVNFPAASTAGQVVKTVTIQVKPEAERTKLDDFDCQSYTPTGSMGNPARFLRDGLNTDGSGSEPAAYDKNQDYSVVYQFPINPGYTIAEDISTDDVHINDGQVWQVKSDSKGKNLLVYVNFPAASTAGQVVKTVTIQVTPKAERTKLNDFRCQSYTPTGSMGSPAYFVRAGLNTDGTGSQPTTYDKNKDYSVVYEFPINSGCTIAADISKADVHINDGQVWKVSSDSDGKNLLVYVNFPAKAAEGPNYVTEAAVQIAAPVAGEKPKGTVDIPVLGDNKDKVKKATMWWSGMLSGNTAFVAGQEYTAIVELAPKEGVTFADNMKLNVNGKVVDLLSKDPTDGSAQFKIMFTAVDPSTPTTYAVTVTSGGNGTVSANLAKAVAGTEIELTAKADSGYHFKEWKVVKGGVTIKDNKFTMPADNVEIKAVFEKDAPAEYTVKFDGNGGKASKDEMTTNNQKLAKLPDATRSGKYQFDGWYMKKDGGTKITTATVFDKNTTVYAHWTYTGGGSSGGGGGSSVTTYAITVKSAKNGDVTASHKTASKGTTVTLTVDPDKGYVLDTLTVLDSKNKAVKLTEKNGKYTFTMPAGKVTVSAAFKAAAPASENPFTDVPSGAYYEDAVIWAVKKDITSGTSATTFNPDGSCTRAQAVTFLWRAAGSPEPKSATMPFTDVPAGSYFEKAVLWAVENGITKGTSDTTFSPDASCTRAQIVTFLWRAGGSPAVSGNSAFSDVASDAYYAAAVAWAEKNGVTGGIGGGLFGSDNTCTRAQIVTFLHRAMK